MRSDTRGAIEPLAGVRLPRPGRVVDLAKAHLRRPGIDAGTVDEVLERYGLAPTRHVENLPFGWRNRTVVVHTSAGRKVLKRYREMWVLPTIVHEHSILRHLESIGFPAVRVEATVGGDTVVELADARFALFGFEEGVNLAGYLLPSARRIRVLEEIGRLLARLHRDVAGFTPTGWHHLGFSTGNGERSRDLWWHLDALERLTSAPPPPLDRPPEACWLWLKENGGRVADEIVRLDRALRGQALSRLVIHGDYGIHNVLFRPDGTATLHDFELARMDWRLIDLVVVLSRMRVEHGRAFLAGYDAVYGSRGDEWRLLPDVWRFYRLCGAVQSWHTFERFGGEERLWKARGRVEEADRIAARGVGPWE